MTTAPTDPGALLGTLSAPEQHAVAVLALALDAYNSGPGAGLFTGPERYQVLAARVEQCAVQAGNLTEFWSLLLRRLRWPVPPRDRDPGLLAIFALPDHRAILRVLIHQTAAVVSLARMVHDHRKAQARAPREVPGTFPDDQDDDSRSEYAMLHGDSQ
jgi:hypothetical protein